jgi:hypothetical protein
VTWGCQARGQSRAFYSFVTTCRASELELISYFKVDGWSSSHSGLDCGYLSTSSRWIGTCRPTTRCERSTGSLMEARYIASDGIVDAVRDWRRAAPGPLSPGPHHGVRRHQTVEHSSL